MAGSRRGYVSQTVCRAVVQSLGCQGFGFWVGCAPGEDRCFRQALSESPYRDRTFVSFAFKQRVGFPANYRLFSSLVVPENLPPKAALRRRTFSVLFRDNIFGALALNRFADMIRKEYGDHFKTDRVEIELAGGIMWIRNKTLAENG